jgi:hypothetical protein
MQLVGGKQEVGGGSDPLILIRHDVARAGGHRISVDDTFDDGLAIGLIGTRMMSSRAPKMPGRARSKAAQSSASGRRCGR